MQDDAYVVLESVAKYWAKVILLDTCCARTLLYACDAFSLEKKGGKGKGLLGRPWEGGMLRYDTSRLSLLVFPPPAGRVAASPSSPSSSSVRSGLRAWLWAAQKEIESRLLRFRLDPRKGPTMEGSLQRRRRRRTAGGSARLVCISPRPPLFYQAMSLSFLSPPFPLLCSLSAAHI